MAKRGEVEVKFHVLILEQCRSKLVADLEPCLVMDYIGQKEIIHHIRIRDIKEQNTTTEKTRMLIDCIQEGDESSYQKFKECLEDSGQSHLKLMLEVEERKQNEAKYVLTESRLTPLHKLVSCAQKNVRASTTSNRTKTNSTSQTMSSERSLNTISSLSKGSTGWRICVRLISKSNIFRKRKMEKRYYRIIEYFSAIFLDDTEEIRGVFFKDTVSKFNKFYRLLKLKEVFYVSGAAVVEANPMFHNAHLELKMNNKTSIVPCTDAVNIPTIGKYDFVKINELKNTQLDELIDFIGVVDDIGEIETVSTKIKKEATKRELHMVDQSGMVVSVTFWGRHARTFNVRRNSVLALLSVKVTEWRGRSLSRLTRTQVYRDPDIPEAHSLRKWYENKGSRMTFTWVHC